MLLSTIEKRFFCQNACFPSHVSLHVHPGIQWLIIYQLKREDG